MSVSFSRAVLALGGPIALSSQEMANKAAERAAKTSVQPVVAPTLTGPQADALATIVAAEALKKSRGAHAQEDHPNRDAENWRVHSLADVEDAKVTVFTRPVHLEPMTKFEYAGIDLKKIAPKRRVY